MKIQRLPPWLVAVLICVFVAAPLVAQDPVSGLSRVRLHGRVLDAATGAPVFGAQVGSGDAGPSFLTDTLGLFVLEVPQADTYVLRAGQLGYRLAVVTLPASAPREFTTLLLEPEPIALEGLQVLVNRFERRQRAYQGPLRVLDQARLQQAPAMTAWDVVQANLPSAQQCNDDALEICALLRGRLRRISLCLDEEQAWGGALDLERIFASDLYMVEVLDMGREVRVYTRRFVEKMLDSNKNLEPLEWVCGGGVIR